MRMERTTPNVRPLIRVSEKDKSRVHCPQCGASSKISTDSYRFTNQSYGIEITCPVCNYKYKVLVNYSKFYRKKTNLSGICIISNYKLDFHTILSITVENISRTGIGFRTKNTVNIKIDSILTVRFVLDDRMKSIVAKKVLVNRIDKDFIGAEFIRAIDYRDKELACYLMG